MLLDGNWIDLIIFVILILFVIDGLRRGFFVLYAQFISFLSSLILALKFYPFLSNLLITKFSFPYGITNVLCFAFLAIVIEIVIGTITRIIYLRIPKKILLAKISKILGVVPAVLDALIVCAFFLTVIIALPASSFVKKDVLNSKIGSFLVRKTGGLEAQLSIIFKDAWKDTLTFLTVKPGSGETIKLGYTIDEKQLSVDLPAEREMLNRVNQERTKVGVNPLIMDSGVVEVARKHSRDMFINGYFSHVSLAGKDPFQRMDDGGVDFFIAGENIALAPDVQFAHQGLMDSPGHRRNILDPEFKRVGIGVIDGGTYGEMFTQDFTD